MMYFSEYEDYCTTIKGWKSYMKDYGISEMKLFEAEIERNTGYFWCSEYDEIGEVGSCGITCKSYNPRNGKNGICRHYRNGYSQIDKVKIIKL